jgi:hypothetical protein
MTRIAVRDALLDAQVLRAAGSAPDGGADLGECLATARRVRGTGLGSWHDAWAAAAASARALAETELAAGRTETARLAFFRSASYDRTAGVMLLGGPADGRLAAAYGRQTETFRRGAALLGQGLVLRPDWENVISPVLDWLLAQPGVDPARVALIGLSLGGYLAPRAASAEHRLAACVADCGSSDLFASALARVPGRWPAGPGRSGARRSSATPKATTSAPRPRNWPPR